MTLAIEIITSSEKNFIELAFGKRDILFSPVFLNQYLDELHLKN